MAIIYCLLSRTRLLIYSDSTWQHFTNSRHSPFRWFLLRILMHLSTGALATGTFNREFYILHGMPPSRIWPGVCPADTGFYAQARADRSEEPAPDSLVRIGFAGKLIARKGVDELLEAVAALPSAADWSLVIVGEGPLKPRLQQLAARLKVADKVAFYGFANTTEMPKLLAGVDIVVVPSRRDMRVLLTIEAMAAGAALIVSDATAVWGPGDLIEHEVTGLVYPSGDPGALADQLRRLLEDRQLLATLRANGAERAESFGPAAFARTTAAAVRSCPARSGQARRSAGNGRFPHPSSRTVMRLVQNRPLFSPA